jgi:hypothetical protein
VADWVTISSLATAGGTLVLAGATFASVRSANRAARVAELSLLASLRPLLLPSRPDDPPQKVGFADDFWVHVPGGGGAVEAGERALYFAISLRNVGTGIAVLHGWRLYPQARYSTVNPEHAPLEEYQRLTRDLYIAAGDVGFWQGAFRDPETEEFAEVRRAVEGRERITVELLYGDHEGGQRTITRFVLTPREAGGWLVSAGRHWNIDRPDPRS